MSAVINLKRHPKHLPAQERFALYYTPEPMSGCWLWLGCERGRHGYGGIKVDGAPVPAHRFSYQIHKGPIPPGLCVLHQCDTPACVNPAHLFLGTVQDNSDDKVSKGRQSKGVSHRAAVRPLRGERNGNSRLTAEQVEQIRSMQKPQRAIAAMFGVTQAAVWRIKAGRMWK